MLAKNNFTIEITDKAVEWIAEEGYNPQLGAQLAKRVIQRNRLNDLSKQILSEAITTDKPIAVDVKKNQILVLSSFCCSYLWLTKR